MSAAAKLNLFDLARAVHVLAARAGPQAARGHGHAAALALRWPLRVAGCSPPHPDQSPHVACWRDCEAVSDLGPWHRPGQGFRVVPAVSRGRRIAGATSGPVRVCTAHRHTCADAAIRMAAAFCMLRCAVRGSARGKTPVGQPGRQPRRPLQSCLLGNSCSAFTECRAGSPSRCDLDFLAYGEHAGCPPVAGEIGDGADLNRHSSSLSPTTCIR